MLALLHLASSDPRVKSHIQSINAITFITNDMAASYSFYSKLGMNCTFGGPRADFTTFGSRGGPEGGDNSYHVNIELSKQLKRPPVNVWNGIGRSILYVADVDAFYRAVVSSGLKPEFEPKDADWGERYFQILD